MPGDGPYVRLWLAVQDGRILCATYACNGCPSSIAASSMTATLLAGRTLEQAARHEPHDVLVVLGGLPEGKGYYADLAVEALRHALASGEI